MTIGLYVLEDDHTFREAKDPQEWAERLYPAGPSSSTIVQQTIYPQGMISTVFTGIDHGLGLSDRPLPFETIIMIAGHSETREHTGSWNEAVLTHNRCVANLQSKIVK